MSVTNRAARLRPSNDEVRLRGRRGRSEPGVGLWVVGLVALAVLMVLPLIWWLSLSLQDTPGLRAPAGLADVWIPQGVHLLDNLRTAVDLIPLPRLLLNSFVVTTSITFLEVFLATLAGYAFAHLDFPGRERTFGLVVLLLSVPQLVLIVPLFQMASTLGLVNTYPALILPFVVTPFGVFTMRQLLERFPRSLLESARMDGAGELRIFFRIVVPLASNAMITLAIFTFFLQLDNLLWPLIVATDEAMYTLPVGFQAMNTNIATPFNALYAVTLVVSLPFVIVYLFAQRRIMDSFATSGLKE